MVERTTDLAGLQVRTLNAIGAGDRQRFDAVRRRNRSGGTRSTRSTCAASSATSSKFPRRRNSDPVAPWIEALSLIRLGLVDPEDVEARYDGDVDGLAAAWPAYRAALERRGAVDFDDQIHRALLVLLTQPEARRAAQRACRVMLVDEFQDLTPAHLLMIRLLASPGGAVFGVGDDDQTIYGYNGADPAWLIDFAEPVPRSRCPSVGGQLPVSGRGGRRRRSAAPPQQPPGQQDHSRQLDRCRGLDDRPQRRSGRCDVPGRRTCAVGEGAATSDIAVLTRVNALLAPVQVALSRSPGVPSRAESGWSSSTGPRYVRRCRGYVSLAARPWRFGPGRRPRGASPSVAIVPSADQRLGLRAGAPSSISIGSPAG